MVGVLVGACALVGVLIGVGVGVLVGVHVCHSASVPTAWHALEKHELPTW